METITLTYRVHPEKKGFSVSCLDWPGVFSQGENISECKKNMIECTEMFLDLLKSKELSKAQYPLIKKHIANPFTFQLTFDVRKAKYVPESKIKFNSKIKSISNIAAIL
jgi:predicted RNase H-like HicB family nuclease